MIWSEIRNDFTEEIDGKIVISIDSWTTPNDNESGIVIAKVIQDSEEVKVEYIDVRAKEDEYAQEIIEESIRTLKREKFGMEE